jgi:hypothetical protein
MSTTSTSVPQLSKSYVERSAIVRPRTYLMHYNGGRPFKVVVSPQRIDVFARPRGQSVDAEHSVRVLTISKFQGYWWGKDTTGSGWHHSSLLIKENDFDYVFVGGEVYRFSPEETIVDFFSPMGNSDVPYPVAYGDKRVYFMLEKRSLPMSLIDMSEPALDVAGKVYELKDRAAPLRRVRQLQELRLTP